MGEFSRDFLAIFPSEGNITLSEGLVIFTAQILDIQLKLPVNYISKEAGLMLHS